MKKEDALKMDSIDPISEFKNEFKYGNKSPKDKIYFCGNSLGLQHNSVKEKINSHLYQWETNAVESHFSGSYPWVEIQNKIKFILKDFLGCSESEIAIMNALSVNLHLLLMSFYRPNKKKYKIIMEENAFSSDRYVVNSQLKLHGHNESDLILLKSKNNTISEEYIIETIERNKDEVCMVLLPGIQYYTGQYFDLQPISKKCKEHNVTFGVDFAHAIGNVKINLKEIDIDFATWCSYKYLNSGPGGISGIYINSRNLQNNVFRLEGWWGNKLSTRFEMKKQCDLDKTAEGWQISNPPIILLDIHLASIEIFKKIGLDSLFIKSKSLTKFLYKGLTDISNYQDYFKILTPKDPERRGAQLSLYFLEKSEMIFEKLNNRFVIDYRKPNVLRIAPVPLYNSYEEVYEFVKELEKILNDTK